MTALIDTNVLVYRFDPRFPAKQKAAEDLLRDGIAQDSVRVPHQALVEFVAVVTRPLPSGSSLLTPEEARREAEELLFQFEILYPNETLMRLALRGMATYQLGWFDSHMWAYAEYFGLSTLFSEDFQHGRLYGSVHVTNPFHHLETRTLKPTHGKNVRTRQRKP